MHIIYGNCVTTRSRECTINLFSLSIYSDGRLDHPYSNEQLTASLDDCAGCIAGLTIRDLQSFTIWDRRFSVFYTRLDIPADLFDVS